MHSARAGENAQHAGSHPYLPRTASLAQSLPRIPAVQNCNLHFYMNNELLDESEHMEMTLELLLTIFLFMTNMLLQSSYAAPPNSLNKGSSLSVEKPNDVLMSSNGVFATGFRSVGDNAYCFAIWFTGSSDLTIVWMANRDHPVNGKGSVLSLLGDGNLVLKDVGEINTWATDTNSASQVELIMLDTGNLVLQTLENDIIWESFKFPTDTLLAYQHIDRYTKLVSLRSQSNYSSGAYSFYFDNDNMLHLLYDGPQTSSLYWPGPTTCYPSDRYKYNSSRIAFFDAAGQFQSSDQYTFFPTDLGVGPERRLTVDFDGNLRMYSLQEKEKKWIISWQALNQPCRIHGICGPNSICIQGHGRRYCSCLPAFKAKNDYDWSAGCKPQFNLSSDVRESIFVRLPNVDFYGFDFGTPLAQSLRDCKQRCVQLNNTCKAVMYRNGTCYLKSQLSNGVQTQNFQGTAYVMLPKGSVRFYNESGDEKSTQLNCSGSTNDVRQLERVYPQNQGRRYSLYLLWFVGAMGGIEMLCIFIGCFCLYRAQGRQTRRVHQGYLLVLAGFRNFSYKELEKATWGFSKEIGRGGGGIVYKGVLADGRVAAIKRLNEPKHEEGEFLTEVCIIGRINHMNLIEMWGFCAEGKHRLLVYEYMECGSLAENLSSSALDWEQRFEIALGTAKGLAYLHEECLEWVLHCDVKPENILLDSNYKPKVADFGLSKLLKRGRLSHISSFSTIRGTRGYMAPEWAFNLPITSKVDVYSYGIVVLELITGKSPSTFNVVDVDGTDLTHHHLVTWVREKINASSADDMASTIEEIMDPRVDSQYFLAKMEILVKVALQCVHEDKDERPSMSKVVEMLTDHENM
ncbi:hypothetical protein Sjap_021308 [Stephania japonica]|uniref:Receptor-like serine/threonine-protein kinase n=1 Tax=Stephania japonica TaxID=461633 RepID=A0AAP0ELR2_9MAGN